MGKKRGEKMVEREFARLGIDIGEYPEIKERLCRLAIEKNSHFKDSAQMAEIIDRLWPRFDITLISKEKMRLCALLHDIGKSGPADATPAARAAVNRIFTHDAFKGMARLSIREALVKQGFKDRLEIEHILTNELGIDVSEEKMIEFWRQHAGWGYDILKKWQAGVIDDEVALIAVSHHIFQHKNPAHINLEKSQMATIVLLAMVDEYQAWRGRGGLEHKAAAARLKQNISQSHVGKRLIATAEKFIEIIADSEEELKSIW